MKHPTNIGKRLQHVCTLHLKLPTFDLDLLPAWWLKVSLLSKHKSGVKDSGPAPMDLSTMNTGNPVNTDSTETKQTKRNTWCGCSSVAAVPEDVVAKDLVTKGTKDSLTKDPVNHAATGGCAGHHG